MGVTNDLGTRTNKRQENEEGGWEGDKVVTAAEAGRRPWTDALRVMKCTELSKSKVTSECTNFDKIMLHLRQHFYTEQYLQIPRPEADTHI